ncbi:hypothetical protein C8R48DRAFT_775223 [Suillus tomentosus]|nr:hypothetical protein C8R48DRAFT_775223 [Suillus tomentosus]
MTLIPTLLLPAGSSPVEPSTPQSPHQTLPAPPTIQESELLDTPVKRGCSTMLTHTTNAHYRIPTINAMGKEMQGFLVGPMDAKDFLQEFLPVTKIPDNTFTSGTFDSTISSREEVQAYELFVGAF